MEYELIDITFEPEELPLQNQMVCDDSELPFGPIEYDENGIPKGQSLAEIRMRQEIILRFWNEWRQKHPDHMVFNEKLKEPILLRSVSLIEAKEHSAKSYKSTLAILQLDEVLAKASPVGRTPAKQGNSNQSEFVEMLVMVYRSEVLGTIKITVGIRRQRKDGLQEKVQYGMSAIAPDQSLMPPKVKTKKAPHKK